MNERLLAGPTLESVGSLLEMDPQEHWADVVERVAPSPHPGIGASREGWLSYSDCHLLAQAVYESERRAVEDAQDRHWWEGELETEAARRGVSVESLLAIWEDRETESWVDFDSHSSDDGVSMDSILDAPGVREVKEDWFSEGNLKEVDELEGRIWEINYSLEGLRKRYLGLNKANRECSQAAKKLAKSLGGFSQGLWDWC